MAAGFSLSELTKLYSSAAKAPDALKEGAQILPGSSLLDKLNKLYFTRSSNKMFATASTLATKVPAKEQKTVAMCLVIVDELHHEDIWRHWVEQEGEYKGRLFIHAKSPEKIKSAWVREHTLDTTYSPDWNSPEVVRAMLSVLKAALVDPTCGRFVFGTESCLPLYELQEVGAMLYREEKSWLDARHSATNSWERAACFASVDSEIVPPKAVWKALPGWVMLTRRHAAEVHLLTRQSLTLESIDSIDSRDSSDSTPVPAPLSKGAVAANSGSTSISIGSGTNINNIIYINDSKPETETEADKSAAAAIATETAETAEKAKREKERVLRVAKADKEKKARAPLGANADLVRAWGPGGTWSESRPGVFAPEEVFFPTCLALLGYLRDNRDDGKNGETRNNDEVQRTSVTFASWKKLGDANPIVYNDFSVSLATQFRATGSAFGRKFQKGSVSLARWVEVISSLEGSNSSNSGSGSGSSGKSYKFQEKEKGQKASEEGKEEEEGGDMPKKKPRLNI